MKFIENFLDTSIDLSIYDNSTNDNENQVSYYKDKEEFEFIKSNVNNNYFYNKFIYDVMKFLNCPVHTIGLGKIMSAGVLLLSSGKKGCRLVGSNARLMAHPIAGGVFGKIFEMENEVAECRRMQNLMIDLLKKETKMTKADIDKIMNLNHDFYLTPEQAVKFGIADKIIGASA